MPQLDAKSVHISLLDAYEVSSSEIRERINMEKSLYGLVDPDVIEYMEKNMDKIKCDLALIPIGGTYTMNVEEAAKLVNKIKPKVAIPTHYGSIVGDKSLGKEFKELVSKDIECQLIIK